MGRPHISLEQIAGPLCLSSRLDSTEDQRCPIRQCVFPLEVDHLFQSKPMMFCGRSRSAPTCCKRSPMGSVSSASCRARARSRKLDLSYGEAREAHGQISRRRKIVSGLWQCCWSACCPSCSYCPRPVCHKKPKRLSSDRRLALRLSPVCADRNTTQSRDPPRTVDRTRYLRVHCAAGLRASACPDW